MAGYEPPTNQEGVRAVRRGIRRTIGSGKRGKAPATADLIGQMIALCPDNMIGRRDRALLCLGFAGAFRRSELCPLEVADLTEVADGLRILIRRSKGDQEGQGQEVAIPRGYRLRPVEAVQAWLAAAEISTGPAGRWGAADGVSDDALADDSAARIVKRYSRRVGLAPAAYAGHSLRLTSAAESGAPIWKLRCCWSVLCGAMRARKRDRGLHEMCSVLVPAVIVKPIGNNRRVPDHDPLSTVGSA
jgi:integrase